MNRFSFVLLILSLLITGSRPCTAFETTAVSDLIKKAKPGQEVLVPPGVYIEDVLVPAGVSLAGTDARNTVIVGSVVLEAAPKTPVRLSRLSLLHVGGRGSSLVFFTEGDIRIQHCFLSSEGGIATVNVGANTKALLQNNIIIGPSGDYGIFGRNNAKMEIINNTIISQGFGIGLMDGSSATIRNCLFDCKQKPAIIRTASDYSIAYSNISSGAGSFYHNHDLILGDIKLRDSSNFPKDATPPELSNKDVAKYDAIALSFVKHPFFKSRNIDDYWRLRPKFAIQAGGPETAEKNVDGSRNTLGAFGGPLVSW